MADKTLLVFDIDGTLAHSEEQHQTAYINALAAMGISDINTQWLDYQHITDSHIFKVNYEKTFQQKAHLLALEDFDNILYQKIQAEPAIKEILGAKKLIERIQNNDDLNLHHVFATGSMRKAALYKLDSIRLSYHPDLVLTANSRDSREEIVTAAIQRAKIFYQQTTYDTIISIGDGIWDYKTAQNLDLEFIGIGAKISEHLQNEPHVSLYPNVESLFTIY